MTSPISSATSTSGDAHLAEQNRVLDVVLSSIADCAYTFDREHRFTYANKPLLELLGLRLDEVVGRTFQQLPYPPELAARLDEQIDVVLARGEKVRGETFFASPSGQNGWFDYIFAPVTNAEGRVVSVAGSTRDITARVEQEHRLEALAASERAARAAAEQANRVKDEFLARLGHELRTPLNAILGWSELLASGRITGEQVKDAAERISRNARSQALLIADLLDMNGIVSGKVRLNLARVDVGARLAAALDAVRLDATNKGLALVEPAAGTRPLVIDGDPERLHQVFWNLLANAIKFTPAGGTVTARIAAHAGSVSVSVADTGIGLAPEYLPRLFERFSQADSSTTRRHGGLGLGLSICKSLVEMHGGRIEAVSDGPGHGSRFTVSLPLA